MRNIKPKKVAVEFGISVRRHRHDLGLSQEEFAEKAEIHRTYVSSIELGKVDISISVALKIAHALNTTLSTIIKEAEKSL